jgi:Ca2+-transporting ATPase
MESDQKRAVDWYTLSRQEVLERLDVRLDRGLTATQVQERLAEHGPNELIEAGLKSPLLILWEQLSEVMVVVLIVAAVISLLLGDYLDAAAIMVIVILNALLGFVQEFRAERAMAALKEMAAPVVHARRGGEIRNVPSRDVVPGDVILLEAGSAIPADARLVETANLRVQEASLTGESQPVDKNSATVEFEDVPIADRHNMVYMGTAVTYGRGVAVVVETGMRTQLGRIAELIQTVESERTPLQRRMAQLGKSLALAALGIVAVVFVLGILRGADLVEMFLTAVAMAVAAVPEGLPAVVTIALALGAQRMLRRQALIRKLPAVETLGSVTVICSDKTGTLTENRMTVKILDVAGNTVNLMEMLRRGRPVLRDGDEPIEIERGAQVLLLAGGALCNDAILQRDSDCPEDWCAVGDPTEGALVIAAARSGLWKSRLEQLFPRVGEVPFSSERKRMSTVHEVDLDPQAEQRLAELFEEPSPYVSFTKGAVDQMLDVSSRVWVDGRTEPMTDDWRQRIDHANDEMAAQGLRVLGVAYRPLDAPPAEAEVESVERELIFVGMISMIDPPRPEVRKAVQTCRTAGIRPVMITGDHPLTALEIAKELGIARNDRILTGQDLGRMSVEELEDVVEDISVYARVSPEHKLNIVQALQNRGHIVAMTGDGVNDAPALRRSDIGVAMGITGTDVAKEAADMVILDDNFATIVSAVREGRTIYDNVRKFIRYTMTSNAGEIYVVLLGPLLGMPLPLTALQILWINLVTDGLPGLALGVEPAERGTMTRPPHPPGENIFARGMGWHILWVGLLIGLIPLGLGYWGWSTGHPAWQTMVFTTLTLGQMAHALSIRSTRESLLTIGLFSNKALLGAVALTLVLQLAVIYLPFLQRIFNTQALSPGILVLNLALSTVILVAVEFAKWIQRRTGVQAGG